MGSFSAFVEGARRVNRAPLVLAGVKYSLTGVGPFLHAHPQDRPPHLFGGTCTLHFVPGRQPYLLLPVIPSK